MPENPVFSIITIARGNLPGLRGTDHSLKLQSFRDFEWIVVDCGTADGTQDYLAYTSACAISRPGGEFSEAMNLGLARASGDYILFLEAGNKLAFANTLARLHNFIRSARKVPDFIYGDVLENGVYRSARPHTQLRFGMFTPQQAMVCKRSILNGLSCDSRYKIAATYDLTAKLLRHAKRIEHYPLPVCALEKTQQNSWYGFSEQFLIRRRLKLSGATENAAIFLLQVAAWAGRAIAFTSAAGAKPSAPTKPGFAPN